MRKTKNGMSYVLLVVIILLIGVINLFLFIYLVQISKDTKKWPSVRGEMLNSEIDRYDVGENFSYKTNIEYQYILNKKIYKSNRIFYGDFLRTNFMYTSKGKMKEYIENKELNVYYNPQKPYRSVLKVGINSAIYNFLVVAICCILLGIAMIINKSFFLDLLEKYTT